MSESPVVTWLRALGGPAHTVEEQAELRASNQPQPPDQTLPPGYHRGPGNRLVETFIHPDTLAYDREQARLRAEIMAAHEAEAAEAERAAAAVRPFQEQDPPGAFDLRINVIGLSTARGRSRKARS